MHYPPLKKLTSVFRKYQEIEAVYLFGSLASGMVHADSDIDLAIYPGTESLRRSKIDILHDLAKDGFCNVDLVYLSENDIVLQYEAVRLNKIVYKRQGFDHGAFFSKVIRQYLDFFPYLQVQRAAYKKRILNGTA
jgi:uncharacterized protein